MGSIGPDHHDPQLASALSSNEAADMATLDCSKLKGSPSERSGALRQLDEALQTSGFIYLANHGVSQTLFDEAFAWISRTSFQGTWALIFMKLTRLILRALF